MLLSSVALQIWINAKLIDYHLSDFLENKYLKVTKGKEQYEDEIDATWYRFSKYLMGDNFDYLFCKYRRNDNCIAIAS